MSNPLPKHDTNRHVGAVDLDTKPKTEVSMSKVHIVTLYKELKKAGYVRTGKAPLEEDNHQQEGCFYDYHESYG